MGCSCLRVIETNEEVEKSKIGVEKEIINNNDKEIKNKLNNLKKSLCIINDKEMGFICKFPTNKNNTFLPVLITRNNIISKNDTSQGKKIKLLVNEKEYIIFIDQKRQYYIDDKYNLIIIEMKEELNINIFLEIGNNKIINNQEIYLKIKMDLNLIIVLILKL